MSTHVFTSAAANYTPKARVLAHSVKRRHPDFTFHLVLTDRLPDRLRVDPQPFDAVLTIPELGIDQPESWIFQHTLVELSTAVKGPVMLKLLDSPGCSQVIYLDPDILVLAPLDGLLAEFQSGSVLLTPHLTEPEETPEGIRDNELAALQHGTYNLGFLGVRNCEEGRRFARWWSRRLLAFCYDDIPRGLFTDQRWADLAPAYFPGCRILRDPAYNVCTWNLSHRKVEGTPESGLTINRRPIVFYHFSGFDSGAQQAMLDKYGSRMRGLYELRKWYVAECERMEQSAFALIPWHYGYFDNGEPVSDAHRRLYRERTDLQKAFPNPYFAGNRGQSYYHWYGADPREPRTGDAGLARHARRLSVTAPAYRIFLSVTDRDARQAVAAAHELLDKSRQNCPLFLIGSEPALSEAAADPVVSQRFQSVPLPPGAGHDETFWEICRRFADLDFLFVKATTQVADWWDLRLAWSLAGEQGIATVSPVWEEIGLPASGREIPRCLEDCVYVTAEAAQAVQEPSPDEPAKAAGGFDLFHERLRSLRYSHLLADHVYVGRRTREPAATRLPAIAQSLAPRHLHIMHSWGGGLDRWVREYCRADRVHWNFVLASVGTRGSFGEGLHLYRHIDDSAPERTWPLDPAIKGTVSSHAGYEQALSEIIDQFGIERILVSSLVGHSLDALRADPPTVMVCHDYYPFCPALNVTFESLCRSCEKPDLVDCTRSNPHNRFFRNLPPEFWLRLRTEFVSQVRDNRVTLVAPSPSVRDNYVRLLPALEGRIQIIPHGTRPLGGKPLEPASDPRRPLRIVIPGSLAPQKGLALFREIAGDLTEFAEVFLLGCGPYGEEFQRPGITAILEYTWAELPKLLERIRPDLGLLLSVVPETFGYCLQELFELAVPPVATRVGSYADRIEDGVNGFLCEPSRRDLLGRLRELALDRTPLARVHEQLRRTPVRTVDEMLADYREVLHSSVPSAAAYFCPDARRSGPMCARLFWKTAQEGFTETHSARANFQPDQHPQALELRIPPLAPSPDQLRLTLSDQPGCLLLRRMRLCDSRDQTLWAWDGGPALFRADGCRQISVLESRDGGGVLLRLAW